MNKSNNEFLKYIYDYCMNAEWKIKQLDLLATKLRTNRQQIRTWARLYAKENFNEEEYNEIDKKINEFTNRNTKLEMDDSNPILKKITGKITDLLWENEQEKKIVLEFIYNYCEKHYYSFEKIQELSNWANIPKTKIELFAKEYATKYLGISLEEYHEKRKEYGDKKLKIAYKNRPSNSKITYENLLNATTLDEIIEILNEAYMTIESLRSGLRDYVIVHHNRNEQIFEELKIKIKMYNDFISKGKKEENKKILEEKKSKILKEKLPLAIETVKKFINDNECIKIEYFCQKYNIDKKVFDEYITIIKEHQTDLYELYEIKINNIKKQKFAILANQIKHIIMYLNNGIEEYDIKRSFDIIDYYKITNIPLKDILKIANEILQPNELDKLKKFVNQNINGDINNPSVIKQIMSEKVIIKYEKDKKDQPIPGTEEYFSDTEKEKLINYLKENKIPLNLKTYNNLYKRYRNGMLDLNNYSKIK